jgi:D-erythronate 2-dehydrogenase
MRVIVTGAGGLVGRRLVEALSDRAQVVATDLRLPQGMVGVEGDLNDPATCARLFAHGCDAVVHLATVPGGAAEADPALGWHVNVEATRQLAEAAAAAGTRPAFVYASSIAVLGELAGVDRADDTTALRPALHYGAHKAMMEAWLATLGRRGALRPLALRLPGIVARPEAGAGLKSAFLSQLFHAIIADQAITLPVSAGATTWLMSAQQAAANLIHGIALARQAPEPRALTLPALRVRIDALVAAIAAQAGRAPQVSYAPDPEIEAAFGRYLPLRTPAADALGFASDGTLDRLVAAALKEIA